MLEEKIKNLEISMQGYKRNFEKKYKAMEEKLNKLKTQNLKVGDIYKFSDLEWYIIDKKEHELKLMSKDIIKTMVYSDDNSNDWKTSKVREYLNSFANTLDLTRLNDMKTNYDEDKFGDDLVRIPTLREIEALPMNIRGCGNSYWAMTASYGTSADCSNAQVFFVASNGTLNTYNVNGVNNTASGVRPVITLSTEELK